MDISIPVSVGELIDKLSILKIKLEKIEDAKKRENIRREYALLKKRKDALSPDLRQQLQELEMQLHGVNQKLWEVEDDIRAHDQREDFGQSFVTLAQMVYRWNDQRSRLKRHINLLTHSTIIEEKSHSNI